MLVKLCRQHLDVQSRPASLCFMSRSAPWPLTSSGYLGNWCRIVSTHCLWNSAFHVPTWTTSHQPKRSLSFFILVLIPASLAVASYLVVLLTLISSVSEKFYALLFRCAVRTEFSFHFTSQKPDRSFADRRNWIPSRSASNIQIQSAYGSRWQFTPSSLQTVSTTWCAKGKYFTTLRWSTSLEPSKITSCGMVLNHKLTVCWSCRMSIPSYF